MKTLPIKNSKDIAPVEEISKLQAHSPHPLKPIHDLPVQTDQPQAAIALEHVPVLPASSVIMPAKTALQAVTATIFKWLPNVLFTVLSLTLLITIWYLATKYRIDWYIRFNNIPTPGEVITEFTLLAKESVFYTNMWISVRRISIGFGIATVLGITLGLLIGRFKIVRQLMFPACEVLRPIPAIAWVPMSIMLWPTNETSIVFITFLGSFFPILLNTIHGVHSVDPVLVRAARSLGASEFNVLRLVILNGALPNIFTGLTVGMGVAWVSLIAAEMISGQFGIGYFTWEAYSLVQYPHIVIGMVLIGVLGLICSGVIRLFGNLLMPWVKPQGGGAH